jgi:hypothetical protein
MPFCSMLLGPRDANVLWTLLAAVLLGYMAFRLRRHVLWRLVGWMFAGSLLGLPLGVALLASAPRPVLLRVLGAAIFVFALYYLVSPSVSKRDISRAWGIPAGAVSGFLGGLTNMSGPPVVIFLIMLGLDKNEIKGTLTFYFAATVLYKIPLLAGWEGLLTAEHAISGAILAFPVLGGAMGGMAASRFLHTRTIRRAICLLLLITAVSLLVR